MNSDEANGKNFHMSPEDFRRQGREVVEWIARYMETVDEFPVLSKVEPGEIRSRLPEHAPQHGEEFGAMLRDVDDILMPGITHWQSPGFFAYFPSNNSGPSILGELLSAGLGVQGMLWSTSPACTELESHVLDWLVEMLGLPDRFRSQGAGGGVLQDTASNSTLCALLAARERATDFSAGRTGVAGDLAVYASDQAHSSIDKAVRIAGLGSDRLRKIAVDATYALRPDALAEAMQRDREAGYRPCMVMATVGTTSSNAIDPIAPIAEICRREGAWLHVDAAMSGTAALCPEFRWIQTGLEGADSYTFNPHKWMFTNFDCNAFWVADRSVLIRTLSVLPEYLRNAASESGAVFDYRDWHVQLGRRFRALKLWFVIRHYGVEGLQHHVREHIRLAQEFAQWVQASDSFELAAPAPLNLVCLRHVDGDVRTQAILDRINVEGESYLTHTRLDGRLVLRVSIGQRATHRSHVKRLWQRLSALGSAHAKAAHPVPGGECGCG
jgi:aromatic-L-amino-acid decarboxylase